LNATATRGDYDYLQRVGSSWP